MNPREIKVGNTYKINIEDGAHTELVCIDKQGDLYTFVNTVDDDRNHVLLTGEDIRTNFPPIESEAEKLQKELAKKGNEVCDRSCRIRDDLDVSKYSSTRHPFLMQLLNLMLHCADEITTVLGTDEIILDRMDDK